VLPKQPKTYHLVHASVVETKCRWSLRKCVFQFNIYYNWCVFRKNIVLQNCTACPTNALLTHIFKLLFGRQNHDVKYVVILDGKLW